MQSSLYKKGFYLEGANGNNAFSYEKRRLINGVPKLYVAPVKEGVVDDLELGGEIVFEDFEGGSLCPCKGLKNFIRTEFCGVPIVIFDNHNHAFHFWMEAFLNGVFGEGATLIHVDQHKDTRVPNKLYNGKTLEDAFLYTNQNLNVGNYIVPAVKSGLFERVLQVNSGDDLKNMSWVGLEASGQVVLNLDMDFFAPEMLVDFEFARAEIRSLAGHVKLITIASSPFFIDQLEAIDLIKKMF
ncbi:MAG: UPF0489 family protein [Candidatus Gracilibacteria bacterium]